MGRFQRVCALLLSWLALCSGFVPARTSAQPQALPDALTPWVPWVLSEVPERTCGFGSDRPLCEWPGRLLLELGAAGGRFEQRAAVDRAMALALPGGSGRWPVAVRVDGREVPVLERGGVPVVQLAAGAHRVEGSFEWQALPERLEVPTRTPLVALSIAGRAVAFPRRDEKGQLWLGKSAADDPQGDRLSLAVTRKLEDAVPMIVTTRIELRVAGRARAVSLGNILLDGTLPLSIDSELPARLEPDGSLEVQVRAGTYRIEARARTTQAPDRVGYRAAGPEWPESEVWVWQGEESLRQVELSGAPAVDPARTELADDWRNLPAYVLRQGAALGLKTTRRGEPSPPPNRIALRRDLWLDLDGAGYTARDTMHAQLERDFRLDLVAGTLGHAAVGDEQLLITQNPDSKHTGVELRQTEQALVAEWRADASLCSAKAVGWSQDVQSLSTTLHMGPGFSVFAARGVDGISQSWVQDWDLFDFFFVLLVAIAAARLIGLGAGLLALVALVISHGERDAPGMVLLVLLACIALLRVLPPGRFHGLVRVGYALTVVWLLLTALPFAVQQLKTALYPQLAEPEPMLAFHKRREQTTAWLDGRSEEAPGLQPLDLSTADLPQEGYGMRQGAEPAAGDAGARSQAAQRALLQDPEATVQTGPGVPTWAWRRWDLNWSGPVDKAHELCLYVLPPIANRTLSLLRVVLIAALIAVLLRRRRPGNSERVGFGPAQRSGAGPASSASLGLLLLLAEATGPARVRAQLPDSALLDQLRARLTRPAECRPDCASVQLLSIEVSERGLQLSATVHAGELTSVRLPGPARSWVPAEITLDRRPDAPAVLQDDGFVHVRVEPGVHLLEARGPLPPGDSVTLALPDRPQRTRVQADGFEVDGVRDDGQVEETLQLSRVLAGPRGETLQSDALPPWLSLQREFVLGVRWELRSRLERVSPAGTPIRVRIPLLPGESVTTAGLEVAAGELQVSFGRDQAVVEWSSQLAIDDRLELVASEGKPWSERWRVACGPIWRCQLEGLTPSRHVRDGRWEPELRPWPGERATLLVRRPEPAQGRSLTIDLARLDVTPGARLLKASLDLQLRTSRSTSHSVRLPEAARVQSLSIDGKPRPLRLDKQGLGFTLDPGSHAVRLEWQQTAPLGSVMRTPEVGLGAPAADARIAMHVPDGRWLLFAGGPDWGPAILFWGYLLLVIAAGVMLARVRQAPLRTHQFVLLGLGLTQIAAPAALLIVGWFFALAYRGRMSDQPRFRHNLVQLVLVGWTLVALGVLYSAVHAGLVLQPDMQVAGADSSQSALRWIVERVEDALPAASIVSVPLWIWRVLMLLWSLWLAVSLVGWSRWAFHSFKHDGLWKKAAPKRTPPAQSPPLAPTPPPT